MEKTIVLCHLTKATISLWEKHIQNDYAAGKTTLKKDTSEKLLQNFVSFLNELNLEVILSFEIENQVTALIKNGLTVPGSFKPYAHEISLLKNIYADNSVSSVYYLDSIYPIADLVLSQKLHDIHREYSADYSFIENCPPGLTGVFFNRSLFEAMQIEGNENSESPDIDNAIPETMPTPLRDYIEKNINHFHVEIHYEHPDLRILRLDFSGKISRSILSAANIFEKCGDIKDYYIALEDLYKTNPELLHHFPSYLELEIFGGCEYACSFCARQFITNSNDQMMTLADIDKIIKFIESGLNDTSISLGGLGEPLEHPQISEILNRILSNKSLPTIVLETNGRHLDKIFSLMSHPEIHKLRIVVNLNSIKNYEQMHGAKPEDREIVLKNIEQCRDLLAGQNESYKKNLYIQTLKITDNEKELDEIYDLADKNGISFLLQKYNSYIGLMPEKRVSDMTPLERFFCWHLRRDLFIRADGSVSFCKQDVTNANVRGNIRTTSPDEIWNSTISDWKNNYCGQYPQNPDCGKCDEYYTFNM